MLQFSPIRSSHLLITSFLIVGCSASSTGRLDANDTTDVDAEILPPRADGATTSDVVKPPVDAASDTVNASDAANAKDGGSTADRPAGSEAGIDGAVAAACSLFAKPDEPPALLTQTGCVDPKDPKKPAPGLVPYAVASQLWSDSANKLRWFLVPAGKKIHVMNCKATPALCTDGMPGGEGHWDFPVGSVLMKEFNFGNPKTIVETRLLMRYEDAWRGYTYIWNQEQTVATIASDDRQKKTFDYTDAKTNAKAQVEWNYPSRQDCVLCHTPNAGGTLGPETAQLNLKEGAGTQLDRLQKLNVLDAPLPTPLPPALPTPYDWNGQTASGDVTSKARSYLHSNCAVCHRPGGAFYLIDLRYDTTFKAMNVCNVAPVKGDLGVTGSKLLVPGKPELSVMSLRMKDLGGGRMPQLATYHVDPQGVAALDEWIKSVATCPP